MNPKPENPSVLQTEVRGLTGVKTYTLVPLKMREGAEIRHLVVGLVAQAAKVNFKAMSELFDESDSDDLDLPKLAAMAATFFEVADFKLFWKIACSVLRGAVVIDPNGGVEEFGKNLNTCGYFDRHPEELYVSVVRGLAANYLGIFLQARAALAAMAARAKEQAEEAETTAEE